MEAGKLVRRLWTPWGPSCTELHLGPGLIEVTTASHGGISVDPLLNVHIHDAWRDRSGWYERDADWVSVALTFPNRFPAERVIEAHQVAKDWHPDQYEQVFRVTVLPGESRIRRLENRRRATVPA